MSQIGRLTTWASMQTFNMPTLNAEFENIINSWNNHDSGGTHWNFVNIKGGTTFDNSAGILFTSLDGLKLSQIRYLTNNFVIEGDSTNGINLHATKICLGETGGSYGGGLKVISIPNASAEPTSDPTGGGILWVYGGALKYRGSSGTVTTVAPA
jgi:hypothetical protein